MNRREFLSQLKSALENKLSAEQIKKNVDYYDAYIDDEVGKGQSEEDVIASLGDPWAIAKTILISSEMGGKEYYSYSEEAVKDVSSHNAKKITQNNEWNKILAIIVIVAIALVVLSVIFGLLAFVIRFAVPILVIVLVIRFLRKK
ncbi:MAG: DUF1700 domain-containing protein [Tyzzerella sp.]|nr:DUF1700 domain-containing protein [Tyzzerella sp.]